jgi:hypothetical protein
MGVYAPVLPLASVDITKRTSSNRPMQTARRPSAPVLERDYLILSMIHSPDQQEWGSLWLHRAAILMIEA